MWSIGSSSHHSKLSSSTYIPYIPFKLVIIIMGVLRLHVYCMCLTGVVVYVMLSQVDWRGRNKGGRWEGSNRRGRERGREAGREGGRERGREETREGVRSQISRFTSSFGSHFVCTTFTSDVI